MVLRGTGAVQPMGDIQDRLRVPAGPCEHFRPAAAGMTRRRVPPAALLALLALTSVRLLVAGFAPLSPDEAYYWTWSRALAPGYLDHPPMVALWIRAGTALAGDTRIGVRLLAPLAAALGSALLWAAAEDILPGRRAGVVAAALLNATLLLGVGAVTMTPDTPLLFFWCAALAALGRLLRTGRGAWWLATGLAAGCALDSKYTALLLGVGLALWLLAVPEGRRWLRTPWPWAGGALAGLLFAPDLLWNVAHGWASFGKQGGRTAEWHPTRALRFEAELLAGQLALATPLVLAACVAGTWRAAHAWRAPGPALLAALTLPGAVVFLEHATGDRVQANWPAILYPAAAIAAGGLVRRWRPAVALGLALAIPVYLQAAAAPFPLPRLLDPTLARLGGWDDLARQASGDATQAGTSGAPDAPARQDVPDAGEPRVAIPAADAPAAPDGAPPLALAADEYGLAAELAWQAAPAVLGVEPRWAAFDLPRVSLDGRAVLLLRSERRQDGPDPAVWADARQVGTLVRARGGRVAERYRLYRVVGRPGLTGTVLPAPRIAAPRIAAPRIAAP